MARTRVRARSERYHHRQCVQDCKARADSVTLRIRLSQGSSTSESALRDTAAVFNKVPELSSLNPGSLSARFALYCISVIRGYLAKTIQIMVMARVAMA